MTTWQEYGINYQNTAASLYIGNSMFEVIDDFNNTFYGQIDELQISSVSRNQAWEKASYWTDKDKLFIISVNPDNNVKPIVNNTTVIYPTADFTSNVTGGYTPLVARFYDLSKNATGWNWNFGDGAISAEQNPTHTCSTAGNYTVTLTVSNANGTNSKTSLISVRDSEVTIQRLVASFSSNATSGYTPLSVAFIDNSTGSPTSWNWRFGDGKYSSLKDPTHTYSKAGKYTVRLTVKNNTGSNLVTKSEYITVK